MRVDAHHHFLDPDRIVYPWLTAELEPLRRRFGPEDLRPELAAHDIARTVLVQTRSSVAETREFLATADAVDFIGGVVGWVDLSAPDVAASLSDLRAGAGGRWLVGIRHQVHDEPDDRWLLRDDVRRGLRAVADAGLAYDLLVRTRELPAALEIVRTLPEFPLVIDHIAKPPIATGQTDAWAQALERFSEFEHVTCKLSGMVTEADWQHWSRADIIPYIERVLEWFGEDRVLFGSDWPVCLLAGSYADVIGLVEAAVTGTTAAARAKVFGDNAARVYGLERPAAPA